eukprot:CAMPEP_0172788054 /NCGR_PEP_ID=MMETSP1074-20121228/206760_1 /TAXON_ID=2916 /ORGANISM="Ceratium fusus, Strain PA161109" /LENGTH=177 /DNA_ID=CAMNT_0013625075 /DNA_START=425 /DNA_END=956 /DNA_ORIENTATION=-
MLSKQVVPGGLNLIFIKPSVSTPQPDLEQLRFSLFNNGMFCRTTSQDSMYGWCRPMNQARHTMQAIRNNAPTHHGQLRLPPLCCADLALSVVLGSKLSTPSVACVGIARAVPPSTDFPGSATCNVDFVDSDAGRPVVAASLMANPRSLWLVYFVPVLLLATSAGAGAGVASAAAAAA